MSGFASSHIVTCTAISRLLGVQQMGSKVCEQVGEAVVGGHGSQAGRLCLAPPSVGYKDALREWGSLHAHSSSYIILYCILWIVSYILYIKYQILYIIHYILLFLL